jgi:hypothetical protein
VVLLGLVALRLLSALPYLGGAVTLLAVVAGTGAVTIALAGARQRARASAARTERPSTRPLDALQPTG